MIKLEEFAGLSRKQKAETENKKIMKNTSHPTLTLIQLLLSGLLFIIMAVSLIAIAVYSPASSENVALERQVKGVSDSVGPQGRVMVGSVIRAASTDELEQALERYGIDPTFVNIQESRGEYMAAVDESVLDPKVTSLRRSALDSVAVAPNYQYSLLFEPNDPLYEFQWNLSRIAAEEAWVITRGSSDVVTAVIDSGILFEQTIDGQTYSSPDFPIDRMWVNPDEMGMTQEGDACWTGTPEDKRFNNCDDSGNGLVDDWMGWDFIGGFRGDDLSCPNYDDDARYETTVAGEPYLYQDNDPQPYGCDTPNLLNRDDTNSGFLGHGTAVASVLGAETNNNQLIAGVDHNTTLMNIRAFNSTGQSNTAIIRAGVQYAIDNGADVINMSFGGSCDDESFRDPLLEDFFEQAVAEGVVLIAASGNDGENKVCYPASSPHVMAVGATNEDDNRTSYSNYSDANLLDVVAPGDVPVVNAPSAAMPNSAYIMSGTSFAAPHVAGLASLILAEYPDINLDDVYARIKQGADQVSGMSGQDYHPEYGFGRINLAGSLQIDEQDVEEPESPSSSGSSPEGSEQGDEEVINTIPIYRLYSPSRNYHFYTSSITERNRIVNTMDFRYEGVGFASRPSSQNSDDAPVYRLFRTRTGSHLYTLSAAERDRAVSQHGFRYEGVGFHANTSNSPDNKPVYRLYRPSTGSHLYTVSSTERDRAVAENGFRYEGIRFYTD